MMISTFYLKPINKPNNELVGKIIYLLIYKRWRYDLQEYPQNVRGS